MQRPKLYLVLILFLVLGSVLVFLAFKFFSLKSESVSLENKTVFYKGEQISAGFGLLYDRPSLTAEVEKAELKDNKLILEVATLDKGTAKKLNIELSNLDIMMVILNEENDQAEFFWRIFEEGDVGFLTKDRVITLQLTGDEAKGVSDLESFIYNLNVLNKSLIIHTLK